MFKPSFKFLRDPNPAPRRRVIEYLPDPIFMQPVDYSTQNAFDTAISSYQGLDELILERLSPSIEDRSVLTPTQYQKLLLKATESLFRLSQQSGDSTYSYCGDMLKYEALQVEFIHLKKRN